MSKNMSHCTPDVSISELGERLKYGLSPLMTIFEEEKIVFKGKIRKVISAPSPTTLIKLAVENRTHEMREPQKYKASHKVELRDVIGSEKYKYILNKEISSKEDWIFKDLLYRLHKYVISSDRKDEEFYYKGMIKRIIATKNYPFMIEGCVKYEYIYLAERR